VKITYNVKGQERKKLVEAISRELKLPAKYLGMPTMSYEVGRLQVDKNGTLTGPDYRDLVADLQGLHGFIPASVEYDDPDDSAAWHDTCDREERDEDGNWDGNETPYYREPRYTEEEFGLGVRRTDPPGEDGMRESDVPEQVEIDHIVIEMPLTGFTPEKLENLNKLVIAKAPLLKAALGVDDLPIQQTADTLRFPWFSGELDGDTVKAYTILIEKICTAAKEKKRITAKERKVANLKYSMRCWLIALGFIGDEYKASRKVLLSKLEGNGTYSGKCTPLTAHCYSYPNGIEGEAMECDTRGFTTLKKAKAHVDAFARDTDSLHFAGAHVEDVNGEWVYELNCD